MCTLDFYKHSVTTSKSEFHALDVQRTSTDQGPKLDSQISGTQSRNRISPRISPRISYNSCSVEQSLFRVVAQSIIMQLIRWRSHIQRELIGHIQRTTHWPIHTVLEFRNTIQKHNIPRISPRISHKDSSVEQSLFRVVTQSIRIQLICWRSHIQWELFNTSKEQTTDQHTQFSNSGTQFRTIISQNISQNISQELLGRAIIVQISHPE